MKNERHYAKLDILNLYRNQLTIIALHYISIARGSLINPAAAVSPGRELESRG